jgi:GYF domain 2
MSAPASSTQWYLARDGQQFGPISEAELAKFIELGHLQPNDLLWREGFPDWRPAMVVFPPRTNTPARPAAQARTRGGPQQAQVTSPSDRLEARPAAEAPRRRSGRGADEADTDAQPRRGRGARVAVLLLIVTALGAVGWFAYPYRDRLKELVGSMSSITTSDAFSIADRKSLEVPPLAGFSDSPEATDAKLQASALWRVIKRDFPDWYTQRVNEAVTMARDSKEQAAIGQHVARKLVELRRQQVANALSAPLPRLKTVATAFFDNLAQLRERSTDACYGFISQGEANPAIVAMLQGSSRHTAHLQAQLTTVFEAIAEGRKQPRVYPQPRQTDYDKLAADLTKRGWTPEDMKLFSNERALAQATPAKVCQMVHDWFAAQLAFSDPEAQMRLLVESLRPVVAG